ncbi:MAG: NAD-dependent protein deacylase [Roseiflexaceae bacterium]|nr:NAD-dependent protein deacylase [Roseiflexaceae bacterium]
MPLTLPERALERLRTARHVVALTGGGMAATSSVPSFRQAHTGEWAQFDVSELATQQGFMRNPRRVWQWYDYRRKLADSAEPSLAHYALVDIEQHFPAFTLITQTIDGLHWRAGSRELIELNGCLRRARCFEAGHVLSSWDEEEETLPPNCPHCGSSLRPDVIMFGEGLPDWELKRARHAVEQCDVLLCVGEISAIEPVSSFPFLARRSGAQVISLADDDSIYSMLADYVIVEPLNQALPALVQAIVGGENTRQVA